MGTVQEPLTRTTCLRSTGGTPPICTAVHPPFVTLCLAGFKALEKGKRRNTPLICTAVRLPFVPQYASHPTGDAFEKILGVGGSWKFLTIQQARFAVELSKWQLQPQEHSSQRLRRPNRTIAVAATSDRNRSRDLKSQNTSEIAKESHVSLLGGGVEIATANAMDRIVASSNCREIGLKKSKAMRASEHTKGAKGQCLMLGCWGMVTIDWRTTRPIQLCHPGAPTLLEILAHMTIENQEPLPHTPRVCKLWSPNCRRSKG